MSVIVSQSAACCGGSTPTVTTNCVPAVSIQQLIDPTVTLAVDQISTTLWRSVKWYIVLTALSGSKIRTYEVYATHDIGTNPSFNVYAIQGDIISQVTDVQIIAGALTLNITNNEREPIIRFVTRIAVPIVKSALSGIIGIEVTGVTAGVLAGTTGIIDIVDYPSVRGVKWLVSITSTTTGKKRTSQVYATVNSGIVANQVNYGFIGDLTLNYVIDVDIIAGVNLRLKVQNNDAFDYRVDVTRIPIQTQLPPTCNIPSDISIWLPDAVVVPPGLTIAVDPNVTIPGHDAAKWLIGAVDQLSGDTMRFELMATRQGATTTFSSFGPIDFVEYGLIGSSFSLDMSTAVVGLNMVLYMTNNERFPVLVNLARIPVSI